MNGSDCPVASVRSDERLTGLLVPFGMCAGQSVKNSCRLVRLSSRMRRVESGKDDDYE
jgi:hypothetical protein